MKFNNIATKTIGSIVAEDFRAAEIFKNAGIDFCCGGNISVAEACAEKGIDPESIGQELDTLRKSPSGPALNFNDWDLDFLCDYIIHKHHKYIIKTIPELRFYTGKIADVHGFSHPELIDVHHLFEQVADELEQHMKKEEEVLFPAVRKAMIAVDENLRGVLDSELASLTAEHEFAGISMDRIRQITHHYEVPEDACNTYLVTLKMLEQFEDDLHIHVHLENNILFPKTLHLITKSDP